METGKSLWSDKRYKLYKATKCQTKHKYNKSQKIKLLCFVGFENCVFVWYFV